MKINRLFSIAAATMMMVACSSEETALNNNPAAGPQMQFTATIAAPNSGATTRTEYTEVTTGEAAGTINVTWSVGDEIALIHNGVKDVATVKTINADGSATINGTITGNVSDGNDVKLVYPAAYVGTVTGGDGYGYEPNPDIEKKLLEQDGTLAYIQDNIDFREDMNTLSVKESVVTLTESADMSSSIAIWKLTLQDNAATPAALAATQVKIKSGGNDLASTAVLTTGKSTLYLAVPVVLEQTITIEATVDEDTYSFTKSAVTLNASAYYQSTVTMEKIVDLSTVTTATTIKNGYTVTGTLNGSTQKYKISIADGATVTFDNATINGVSGGSATMFAGINCEGNATIILKDGTTNTVKGFSHEYPGIYVPENKTLTIKGETAGTGKLTASSSQRGTGAGIGGGMFIACGNIEIQGGVITAYGGDDAAGIGSGMNATCGNITISGGTVEATGKDGGAGIGSGGAGSCVAITITTGVTSVTATKGASAPNSIGAGAGGGTCGTVTIGCTLDNDGNPVGGTTGAISTSPYTYDPNAPVYTMLSAATSSDCGKVVCAAGHLHDAKTAVPSGCTAVGILGKVTATGHGLILALKDATSQNWNTINGWTPVTTYAGTTLKVLPDDTARGANLTSYTTLGETTVSNWAVAQKSDYETIFTNLGSTEYNNGRTYDDANVNAYITTGVGGTAISGSYWSATVYDNDSAWSFGGQDWGSSLKSNTWSLRPVLGF